MSRSARVPGIAAAAVLAAALLLTGCGGHGHSAAPAAPAAPGSAPVATSGDSSAAPAPDPSELARMQKLVDEADSAAAKADADAAGDN